MAHFFRITLAGFLLLVAFIVNAAIAPTEQYYIAGLSSVPQLGPVASKSGGCSTQFAAIAPLKLGGHVLTRSEVSADGGYCNLCTATFCPFALLITKAMACPANSSSNGAGGCVCSTNYEENAGQCVKKNPCPAGQHEEGGMCVPDKCPEGQILSAGVCIPDPDLCPDGSKKVDGKCPDNKCKKGDGKNLTVTGNMPTAFCYAGCTYASGPPPFPMVCTPGGVAGGGYCVTTYYGTGDACNGAPSLPSGGTTGGGNTGGGNTGGGDGGGGNTGGGNTGGGNTGGGGGGGKGPGGNTGTGGAGGGGTGGNTGSGGDNGNGSDKESIPGTETGTDGKCPAGMYKSGGKCYPNENVTTDPDGTGKCPAGYTKKDNLCIGNKPLPDDSKGDDFCKQNPTLDICKTGSFGGTCKTNFKCDGDAVQCAMAREQHIRNCQIFEAQTDESLLYDSIKNLKGDQTGELKGNETVNIGSLINTSDALGGGSCISDLNITVWNSAVSLPISQICPYLAMLGNVLVAVSMLLAARIITRG